MAHEDYDQGWLEDATAATSNDGALGQVGDHLIAVENTPRQRHMIVCSLCS
jgi:nitrile hydratase